MRIAARYESETTGSTQIGYPTQMFLERGEGGRETLGSGFVFSDELVSAKEMGLNAVRIEGWRRTNTYGNFVAVSRFFVYFGWWTGWLMRRRRQDFAKSLSFNTIRGFDVVHQLQRLRHGKNMSDRETECIMRNIADNLYTYEQVIEVTSTSLPCLL